MRVEDAEGSDGFTEDDDPRGKPLSLVDAVPAVPWQLSLLAGVCCGAAAVWAWLSSMPSWVTIVASVTAAAWLIFAIARLTIGRDSPAKPGDALSD